MHRSAKIDAHEALSGPLDSLLHKEATNAMRRSLLDVHHHLTKDGRLTQTRARADCHHLRRTEAVGEGVERCPRVVADGVRPLSVQLLPQLSAGQHALRRILRG